MKLSLLSVPSVAVAISLVVTTTSAEVGQSLTGGATETAPEGAPETAPGPPGISNEPLVIAPPLILESHWNCNSGRGEECPADRWCDEDKKQCYPKREEGERCNANKKCFSGICNKDGRCDPVNLIVDPCFGINTCPPGQLCDEGECYVDACADVDCGRGTYCDHGICLDNDGCEADTDCPDQFYCDVTEEKCQWVPFCGVNDDCERNELCRHGYCVDDGKLLANGQECEYNAQCQSGYCDKFVFEDSNTNNPQLCRAKKEDGDMCDANFECESNICLDFECTDVIPCVLDSQCPSDHFCDIGGTNTCVAKFGNGVACDGNRQCQSGWCNTYLFEDSNTNNPDLCQAKKANGAGCDSNVECASNVCYDFECRAEPVCNNDGDCSSNQFCNLSDNTCDNKLADGSDCDRNSQCVNNICDDGECTSKLPVGGSCSDGSDCLSGVCNCRTNRCIANLQASGGSCERTCECRSALYCDFDHDKTCKPLESLGGHCHENSHCASGLCHVFECPWGLCGTETCVPVDGESGDYCVDNSHCASNRCRGPRGSRTCRTAVSRLGGPFTGTP